MKLHELFGKSQDEILAIMGEKLSARSSAVWIAEGVEDIGEAGKCDVILAFFDGSLMMASARVARVGGIVDMGNKRILDDMETEKPEELQSYISQESDYFELSIFKRGWYEWLNS